MIEENFSKLSSLEKNCSGGKALLNQIKNMKVGIKKPTVTSFLEDNEFIMLGSIFDAVCGRKPKMIVFYELVKRTVPKSQMFNFYEVGYHQDFGIEIHYADLIIESLISSGYKIDTERLLRFDIEDYKLFVDTRDITFERKPKDWDENRLQKYERVKSYKAKKVEYILYTDGGYQGSLGIGAWAFILLKNTEEEVCRGSMMEEHSTANRMEILAITNGLRCVPDEGMVEVRTDSQYCIGVMNGTFRRNKNTDLLDIYDDVVSKKRLKVLFKWVKGHSGDLYNEECDSMCNEAAGVDLNGWWAERNIQEKERRLLDISNQMK